MSYEKHNFQRKSKLYASQLNEMDEQILKNEEKNSLVTRLANDISSVLEMQTSSVVFVDSESEMTDNDIVYVLKSTNHIYKYGATDSDIPVDFHGIDRVNTRINASGAYSNDNGMYVTAKIPFDMHKQSKTIITLKNLGVLANFSSNVAYIAFYDADGQFISDFGKANYWGGGYFTYSKFGNDIIIDTKNINLASLLGRNDKSIADAEYIAFSLRISSSAITESDVIALNPEINIEGQYVKTNKMHDTGEVYKDTTDNAIKRLESEISELKNGGIVERNKDILGAVHASSLYGIHGDGNENLYKQASLLVTTDVHSCEEVFKNAIEYLNAIDSIDVGVCLGDIQASIASPSVNWYINAVKSSEKNFYTILGNHDFGNGVAVSSCVSMAQAVSKYMTPVIDKMGMTSLSNPYYYFDMDKYKIRFICLNSHDTPDTVSGSNYNVFHGADCFSQNQINWFINTLNTTPSDYSVVILAHDFPYAHDTVDSAFTQVGKTHGESVRCYNNQDIIPSIVDAWVYGKSQTKSFEPSGTYAQFLPTLNANCDFTSRGTGKFICYVVGHTHTDIVAKSRTYQNQIAVGLCATADDNWQNKASDLPRVKNEKSQDAITVVSFDTRNKRINLVRVGSNKTIYMTDRTMVSIPY